MSKTFQKLEPIFLKKLGPVGSSVALFFVEVIQIILISSAIIIPIRYFLIQPFYVKGASMEPNFYDRLRTPERGEIVVFRYPRNPSEFFIKRVIGLPGETVEVSGGHVTIYNEDHPNGVLLTEAYLGDVSTDGMKKSTLGADEYWVMGDNRPESMDSRSFGPVKREQFIGRVWVRGLPLNRASTFPDPTFNL
jgi:signal peptidase I